MHIIGFTIKQADLVVGNSPIREQAVSAAKTRAAVYTNRGVGRFRCIAPADNGPMFWNAAGGCSNASGVFQNIESGWTFMAKGVIQYIDGSIEWDHSTDGRFEQI